MSTARLFVEQDGERYEVAVSHILAAVHQGVQDGTIKGEVVRAVPVSGRYHRYEVGLENPGDYIVVGPVSDVSRLNDGFSSDTDEALNAATNVYMRTRPLLLCDTHGALENQHATRCRVAAIRDLDDCRYITVWITKRQYEVATLGESE